MNATEIAAIVNGCLQEFKKSFIEEFKLQSSTPSSASSNTINSTSKKSYNEQIVDTSTFVEWKNMVKYPKSSDIQQYGLLYNYVENIRILNGKLKGYNYNDPRNQTMNELKTSIEEFVIRSLQHRPRREKCSIVHSSNLERLQLRDCIKRIISPWFPREG